MTENSTLLDGNNIFKNSYFKEHENEMLELAKAQHPEALYIGCSDSRALPNLITNTGPGKLFVTRNIGNMVPPYNPEAAYHATASAIEYAVAALNVKNIIVCGHTQCGAMAALHDLENIDNPELVHTKKWLTQALDTRTKAVALHGENSDKQELLRLTEKLSVVAQLENLLTFPSVKKRVDSGDITLHGWIYSLETGSIEYYDHDDSSFKSFTKNSGEEND